mgnify:CR=1 FL=1
MKTCYIFGAADGLPDRFKKNEEDLVIAADSGINHLEKFGALPDIAVGDFDSLGFVPDCGEVIRHPVMKDDTDTMAAIRHAVTVGCGEIWLYCAMGGRLDHLLGNLQAAAFAVKHGVWVRIIDRETEIRVFTGGCITVPEREGWSLSVLALSDRCTGVSIHGTKYELENVTVENSFPIGVSNQWQGDAEISVAAGVLAVMESKM